MKHTRIIVTHCGGPEVLQVLEEERLEPKYGEVRVRVLAAGVALPDIMAREGIHPETPRRRRTAWSDAPDASGSRLGQLDRESLFAGRRSRLCGLPWRLRHGMGSGCGVACPADRRSVATPCQI